MRKLANIVGRRLGHCLLLSSFNAHRLTDLSTISVSKSRKANSMLCNLTSCSKHEIINKWSNAVESSIFRETYVAQFQRSDGGRDGNEIDLHFALSFYRDNMLFAIECRLVPHHFKYRLYSQYPRRIFLSYVMLSMTIA